MGGMNHNGIETIDIILVMTSSGSTVMEEIDPIVSCVNA
jgi:hypothetical protein